MTAIKSKTLPFVLAGCLSLVAVFYWGNNRVRAANEPGSVKLDPDFGQKVMGYVLSKPLMPGPFTGKKEADLEEIYSYFADPVNKFSLILNSSKSQAYQTGDTVSVEGAISYALSADKSRELAASSKDCSNCPSSAIYRFPKLYDLGVFVQVFRKDEDKVGSLKGDYLVDEFYAAKGIELSEKEKKDFKINWAIPEELKEGKYYFSLSVNASQRFPLAGTPLLANIPAQIFDFQITNSGEKNGLELDKNNITINEKGYVYRSPAPTVEPVDGEIKISAPLSNLNPGETKINCKYQLYRWGQEDAVDLIDTKEESKFIDSGEKTSLEYAFKPDEINSVYNLKIIASNSGSISIANVRFVVKNHNRGVFDFLGRAENAQGEEYPVFCLRNAQWTDYFSGKLVVTALDNGGRNLFKLEKDGDMEAATRCFVIQGEQYKLKGSPAVSLKGEIYDKKGQLVDQKTVNLVSQKKNGDDKPVSMSNQYFSGIVAADKYNIILIVAAIIILIAVGYYYFYIKNKPNQNG